MKFCVNCGNEIEGGASFCVNCGERFEEKALEKEQIQLLSATSTEQEAQLQNVEQPEQPPTQSQSLQTPPKKPLSRKSKFLIGVGVAIFAIGFGAKYFISQHYDGKNQIKKMHDAYMTEDKEAFYSYFDLPEDTVGGAEEFYEWVKEEDWSYLREDMLTELGKLQNGYGADPIDIVHSDALRITNEKIFLGLFEKTVFSIRPLEVSVSADLEGTAVTIADKTVTTGENDSLIGNFIPGTYEVSYDYAGPYTPITGSGKVKLTTHGDYQYVQNIDMDYTSIDLYTNYEDAIVYINDVSTKKTVGELEKLYPVVYSDDVKVHLVAKNAAGEDVISKSYPLTNSFIEFEFEADQELALVEDVKEFYDSFREDYSSAISSINFDYVEDYFPQGELIAKEYKKFIEDHKNIPGYRYDFTLNEVKAVKKISDTVFQLTSNEEFDYYSEEDGGLSYIREKSYKISHIDDEFKILEIKDLNTKKTKK